MCSAFRCKVFFCRSGLFCGALVFLFAALAFATPGSAQVSFQPSVHSSPNIPTDIFQVKLFQVGKPDLITTQAGSNMVSVFLNDGNGNFPASPSATYLTGGVGVNSVVSADFDEDGFPDLATANCGNSPDPPQTPVPSSVSILFQNGDKTFKPHVDYPLPACPDSIGFLNAVSGNTLFSLIVSYGQSTMTLLANDHFGQFSERTIQGPAGSQITGVSAANYRGLNNGLDDIAAILNGNSVVLFLAQPDGTYSAPVTIFSMAATLLGANTVGFNSTGRPDLMVPFTSPTESGVILLANQGGGVFTSTKLNVDPIYKNIGHKAAEGDLQNTGLHSVVLPIAYLAPNNQLFNAFAVFTQPSKGVWNGPIYLAGDIGGTATAAVVADFDGDNKPDIATAGGEDSHMFVFRNTTSAGDCTFFAGSAGVHVCSPASGATVPSPVAINSAASGGSFPIVAIKAYIDGTQVAATETNTMRTSVAKAAGNHQLAVNAWDSNDKVYQTIVNFTVGNSTACSVPSTAGVHICKPAAGSTVTSPVAISAAANGGTAKISAMKAYIDSKLVASSSSGTLSGSAVEAAGTHKIV
ncbi:MAG TPA: VCBS repeat-containing protein, partial [Alphaproteobacteria bacterium]|nr:VCBS repeat-containing protein [Alphaproteobacteria bacterium]